MSKIGGEIRTQRTAFFTERLLAGLIDLAIALGISLFPRIGWIFGLLYFLFKDSIVVIDGQSFGRRFFKLKVVSNATDQNLVRKPDKALIRQIVFLIPILNLIEVYRFFFKQERYGALWTQTKVIKAD